ncbi:hypothetical protein HOI83_00660 [Candidatus Uhrbacteria bacterium]|jgi:hypothetical protein|nr:hypothetical protein [Candidatus Uhrbacteria bacterium]
MKSSKNNSIVDDLLVVLRQDSKAISLLKNARIHPDVYVAYVYDSEINKIIKVGYIGGAVIVLILGGLSFISAQDLAMTVADSLLFGLGGGALGALIAFGTLQILKGKRSKYINHPGESSSGFTLIGILNRLSVKSIEKLDDKAILKIREYQPDFSNKRYQRLPTEEKTNEERQKMLKMTPKKKSQVGKLKRIQKFSLWMLPFGLIAFFVEGLLYIWVALFFGGLWFCAEGVIAFIERRIEFHSGWESGELYGWPARASAIVIIVTALMIAIIPSILGIADAFGVDIIELIF